jgi:HlyD family secretion protein
VSLHPESQQGGAVGIEPDGSRNGDKPASLSERVRSLRLPDRQAPRGGNSWLPWLLCVVLAGSTVYLALNRPAAQAGDADGKTEAGATPGANVFGAAADGGEAPPGAVVLESKGNLVPIQLIQVSPKVGGMVTKLNILEGMRVDKGFVLAELEKVDYQAEYDRAAATAASARQRYLELKNGYRPEEIEQAEQELHENIALRDQLKQEYKRNEKLRGTPAVSPTDFEKAQSAYWSQDRKVDRMRLAYRLMKLGPRDERIAAAKAEWAQNEADVVKAKWRLDNTIITAPIQGIILSKKTEEGNLVNPSAFSNGLSASLCEMADLTQLEVDLSIAERDIAKVKVGQKCQVRAEAYQNRPYKGRVSRIMPQADRSKGSISVRVLVDIARSEEGQYLRPEMGAFVVFFNEQAAAAGDPK